MINKTSFNYMVRFYNENVAHGRFVVASRSEFSTLATYESDICIQSYV